MGGALKLFNDLGVFMNMNQENFELFRKAALNCIQNNFPLEKAYAGHDVGHVISGYPFSKDGEDRIAGWELAVLTNGTKNPKNPSDEMIEGYLAGLDWLASASDAEIKNINDCYQVLDFPEEVLQEIYFESTQRN